ncbi:heavy-metal-associated domain-containing protein [Corynebacterium sp. Marseille-P3884]|uniref:heavy-metal-associated domain-containing protein n=1 Tax=Corynebacterium sp. Marseille-P3884 TaxID=2495409 RepID=UPI001B3336C9|nr:heavy-metal-associated domain-containing protein [Corynebacterium sp. Marseille-P3884]MBP3949473.1 heavy-metal-associated domain-containing protein [Corynebacterium sp. Marseille-P3884]
MADQIESTQFTVEGMTCGHCEASVVEEVSEIDGVTSVTADHKTGAVTVTGAGFTREQVAAAVEEAGYSLV